MVRDHGVEVTNVFYDNLLTEHSELNEIFNQDNQINGHQARALAGAVYAYAQNIETPEVLEPMIKHITQKHASLFVQPEQYEVVGKYLLEAFSQVLGPAFTSNVWDAWSAAYNELARTMINAEAKLYRSGGEWTDWKDFFIQEMIPESSEVTSIILRPVDEGPLPTYLPGQYISVRIFVPSLNRYQPRQYSLSDRYTRDHYRISVKREDGLPPGSVSNALHNSKVGDKVQLSRPSGDFTLDTSKDTSNPLVLISAGVGLTPLMSMLNTTVVDNPGRPVAWIHGYRNAVKRPFANHISVLAKSHNALHITRFCSRPQAQDRFAIDYEWTGRVDLKKCDAQKDLFLDDDSARYYVCGPSEFMDDVEGQLQDLDIEPNRIWMEHFGVGGVQPA